ncbi:non-ribosomal peptide synthetase [Pigmentiphaga litoralis]|uniref:Amino acid adenylation domain-containing protein n=1 Tax=Pigmentiphaga litoralis TaxID=516702 RepID=A0A7Y9IZ72_9BURK|nr:non-ribosomal peptide synthetase [Pigmentiphaga litoralis]NYE25983.1 amino acid adenylation domain-containing protein [Pigmentiphaga litoralis]NYE85103.1 amino acid adenylation domain-containing protein [Pigmentiphaga litoralis]
MNPSNHNNEPGFGISLLTQRTPTGSVQGNVPVTQSGSQQQLWFLQRLDPALTAYNLPSAFRLAGALSVTALSRALQAVVEKHGILRTRFYESDGVPMQCTLPTSAPVLEFVDLSLHHPSARQSLLETNVAGITDHQFDLTSGVPLVARLVRMDAEVHILAVCMHHIVSDGWSNQILIRDLARAYQLACPHQEEVQLDPLPLQFTDFAVWQRNQIDSGAFAKDIDYWNNYLGKDVPPLELPLDFKRPDAQTFSGSAVEFDLGPVVAEQLNLLCRQEKCTPFVALFAAWQLVLSRVSGQPDFAVGVPTSGRTHPEVQDLIGFFVTTQAFMSRAASSSTVRDLCRAVRSDAIAALRHADAPIDLIMAARPERRELNRSPIFQVLFGLQVANSSQRLSLDGLQVEPIRFKQDGAKYELALEMTVVDTTVRGRLEFNTDLFTEATARRLSGYYLSVLKGMTAGGDCLLAAIDMLDDTDTAELRAWSENPQDYGEMVAVHRLFESCAKRRPHSIAVVFEREALTYRELDARSNRLANRLLCMGVGADAKIGVVMNRSVDMVAALLAILKAGAAYVPLDPDYPRDRLAFMVADSGVKLLLTQSVIRDRTWMGDGVHVVDVDLVSLDDVSDSNPTVDVHSKSLAYVIYTSGSTGRPKGVGNSHGALFNRLAWMQQAYRLDESDTIIQKTPYSFDVSVWEFFWPLMIGARLLVAGPGDHRDPARLVDLIIREQVTTIHFVPSMLQAFLEFPGAQTCTSIRRIVCSGEALPAESQLKVWKLLPRATLYNLYGPTEAAIDVTHWTCVNEQRNHVPIGSPIGNVTTHVLDNTMRRVPCGVAGELYLGGVGLARGYEGRQGLTAERFVADPTANEGGRLYRTGDLARWNAEGHLEYLGRLDHQVKIRGFRIELGELEAILLAQPEVREAVVVARRDQEERRLVGYVSLAPDHSVDAIALKQRLVASLPDHMVPSAIVLLDKLPLNSNGKVDRNALPEPEYASEDAYEAPNGETEQALARMWADMLGVARVGRKDNFFRLGGHSLLALRLLGQMQSNGYHANVRDLFANPVLSNFATSIRSDPAKPPSVSPNPIPMNCSAITPEMLTLVDLEAHQIRDIEANVPGGAANIQDIYPLVPLQEGILFHHRLQLQGDAYVTPRLLAFDSKDRLERFIASFNKVIQRHDILRTAVRWEGLPEPVQVVYRKAELQMEWLQAEGDVSARLNAMVDPQCHRLDVRHAPMIRAIAARDEVANRWLLQLPSHHLVMDHTTLEHIVDEIRVIEEGRECELSDPVGFRQFVADIRSNADKAGDIAFFAEMLGDVTEPTMPFGCNDVHGTGARTEVARLSLDVALCETLRQQAKRHGVTAAAVFHLAWGIVLSRTAGTDDPVFGTVLFGRMQESSGASQALGLFINTLPIRIQAHAQDVVQSLLNTQGCLNGLMRHEHASLALAQRCSGVSGAVPLFSSLLNYRHIRSSERDGHAVRWEGIELLASHERSNYPISMSIDDSGLGFDLVAHADVSVGASRLCGFLQTALEGLAEALSDGQSHPMRHLSILNEQERHQLRGWMSNPANDESAMPVHLAFQRQARARPAATALIFNSRSVSYGALNGTANVLAHRLIKWGVRHEVRVGVFMDRSIEMIVALLAILKAGGTYVPLDPDYPTDRLSYMVEDSGTVLLLSQAHLRGRLPAVATIPVHDVDLQELARMHEDDPSIATHGEHLAYLIYTSGSTGQPKGVAVRHLGLAICMEWMQETYVLTQSDTVLHKAPFSFDVSVWEIFWPLSVGARLVIAAPGDQRDPVRITKLIVDHDVSVLNFVPSMLQAFLANESIEMATRLRYIICGGEAMPAATRSDAIRRLRGVSLQNLYGPTETTIHVTQYSCRDDGESLVPIGRPVSGTQVYVLDANMELVPRGVEGELFIGGALLARGYLNRQALSAERFVANPHGELGDRLYRTGDLVRWREDGELQYLGRLDHQVKIRGLRIELGEVEARLNAVQGVKAAVVVATDAQLLGYVTAMAGHHLEVSSITAQLRHGLPDYMVPSSITVLDALPLNINGKVDRKALPLPSFETGLIRDVPHSGLERQLADIWAAVLGVTRVGRFDNFFELGGHSLLALNLLDRIRATGLQVEVRTLFEHPILADFASAASRSSLEEKVKVPRNLIPAGCTAITKDMLTLIELEDSQIACIEAAVPGGAANIQDIYPLAPLQEGIFFHHMLQRQGDAYVTPRLLSFDTRQRIEKFITAFNMVIQRHDILRSAIVWEGLIEPAQVVYRQADLGIEWLDDLRGDIASALSARVDPSFYRMDVQRAPLVRAVAAQDPNNDRWLLQLPSHHLILDHTTLDQIISEVALIQEGRIAELTDPIPYRQVVAHARLGVSEAEHRKYFTEILADVDEPTAPFGLTNVYSGGLDSDEAELRLDSGLSKQVRQRSQQYGVSAAALFHLAWGLVLAKTSAKGDDVVFGTVLFGRMASGAGAQRAVGLFINTLPIRIRFLHRNVLQSLKETQAALAQLLNHEHASLSLAQRCSQVPADAPLFTALFNYRYSVEGKSDVPPPGLQGIQSLGGTERSNYPVDMSVDDLGEGFRLVAQVPESIGAARLCRYLATAVADVVDALSVQPQRAIAALSILSDGEAKHLLRRGDKRKPAQNHLPVHRLFEKVAMEQPATLAVLCGNESLSYDAINRRANILARHLVARGVTLESRVGLALERSADMVVGVLAVLKAGGAYVPLDPNYPLDRLVHMLADSRADLLLTQRSLASQLPRLPYVGLVELDDVAWESDSIQNLDVQVDLRNLAYLIYTSGSTGKPKGVGISHGSLAEHARVSVGFFALTPADRVLQFATLNFDGCIEQLFAPLIIGASVVIRGAAVWDSETFYKELIRQQISVVDLTTAYWMLLVQDFARRGLTDYGRLRQLHVGGEALPPDGLNAWRLANLSHVKLLNTYGPTEATVTASVLDCSPYATQIKPLPSRMSIGRALEGRSLQVVDPALSLSPVGIPGELLIGGDLLARGYVNRPGLTAERFIADEFGEPGTRRYRTGDLVCWNAESELDYLGRIDDQVKIRGFRVEPGEIEAVVQQERNVRQTVVVHKSQASGSRLIAYVALERGEAIDIDELRRRIVLQLPDYMVPSQFVIVDELPMSPNGKINKKALPEPVLEIRSTYEAPLGNEETAVAAVWADVLGLARLGRHDNFFELGGHSLLALRAFQKIREILPEQGFELASLYGNPTVATFVAAKERKPSILKLNRCMAGRPPLIILHDGWGSVLDSASLAQSLGGTCSVLGLPYSLAACSTEVLPEGMAGLALRHCEHLLSLDYSSYRLAGWCLGGALAPLVAKELVNRGKKVDLVLAIDPFVPQLAPLSGADFQTQLLDFLAILVPVQTHKAMLRQFDFETMVKGAHDSSDVERVIETVLSKLSQSDLHEYGSLTPPELCDMFLTAQFLDVASATVCASPLISEPMTVWWSSNRSQLEIRRFSDWAARGAVQHRRLPESHLGIIRAATLFDEIGALIRRLD